MSENQEQNLDLEAFKTLGRFLIEDEWYPQEMPERNAYTMRFQGRSGSLRVFASVRPDARQLLVYAVAPNSIPEELRGAAAEFLTRANYGIYIGNFEMDWSDGEVRYKSSIAFEGCALTYSLVRNAIYPAVHMMDKYLPGLLKVAYGGKIPADAIKEIEG